MKEQQIKIFQEEQSKFYYYSTGLSLLSIGFYTKIIMDNDTLLILPLISLVLSSISMFFGIEYLLNRVGFIRKDLDAYTVLQKTDPINKDVVKNTINSILSDDNKKLLFYSKSHYRILMISSSIFLIWVLITKWELLFKF